MKNRQTGITLMELLTVVAIVGILAAIAYPSYRAQALRSNRSEGKIAVEQRAQSLEKCYTRYMAYDNDACDALTAAATTPHGYYSVAAETTATTFTVTATPQGGQSADKCGNLTLDQAGVRGRSGSEAADRCW